MAGIQGERRRKNRFFLEPLNLDDNQFAFPAETPTEQLIDVSDEAQLTYQGQSINITPDKIIDIRKLGTGNFGYVMLAEVDHLPGLKMAVKIISFVFLPVSRQYPWIGSRQDRYLIGHLSRRWFPHRTNRLNLLPSTNNRDYYTAPTDLRTIRIVGSGVNPHVTTFYAALAAPEKKLLICMEACDTSMEKFYAKMHEIQEIQHLDLLLKRMISHIVDALAFLKSHSILHRDVKPSNILINKNPVVFKLCDFGICGQLVESKTRTMMIGTGIYLAPERIDRNKSPQGYGVQSDMWALGLSICEIANNKQPFLGMELITILTIIETWIPELPSYLSTELQQLVNWLMKVDQAERPAKYEHILALPAIQMLPSEITDAEEKMVKHIIEQIPHISDE